MRPLLLLTSTLLATALHADTGSAFYGDPPDAHHPWAIHDRNRPQPPLVQPGSFSSQEQPGQPPSDAIILFDGTDATLTNWIADKQPNEPTKWIVKDRTLQCVPGSGYVRTVQEFADCQLHVEWSAPTEVHGDSQGRGNSGVFLMGMVEIQVLDNHNNPTYADGFAGSVYGVSPPAANPLRKPGEWQMYDIVFHRPVYDGNTLVAQGTVTVFSNGVLVQDHTPIEGAGGHKARSKEHPFPAKGPLKLQDHGNPVRYRNIWYRPLPTRNEEGGTTGALSEAATTAKRQAIATTIRADAAKLQGNDQLLRYMESLCYETDTATQSQVQAQLTTLAQEMQATPADKLEARKSDILRFHSALQYLAKFNILPADFTATQTLAGIVTAQEWEKKH
jgi:hypothetical protein